MFEIVHLHIPKTGGSSLLELYHKNFGFDAVISVKRAMLKGSTSEEISQLLCSLQRPELKVLHGHFYWREISSFIERSGNIKIVAFFRHPVERVISNFFFFKKRIRAGKVTAANQHRLKETLLEYAALPECKNRMSRFMEGLEPEDLFFAGLMENFENDVEELFSKLDCKFNVAPRENINLHFSKEKESITIKERNLIELYNQEDMDLYNRVLLLKNQNRKGSI
ncbi:MAG: hypothetical protein EA362_11780 [Saprospirales bacterium]|nr:MAG: hypothetical protein EA362_11780 [Saprospirales bacterium]